MGLNGLTEKGEQAMLLSRHLEELLRGVPERWPGRGGLVGRYAALVGRVERELLGELRGQVQAAEDAMREVDAPALGPRLGLLPAEVLARHVAPRLRMRTPARLVCRALRSFHDANRPTLAVGGYAPGESASKTRTAVRLLVRMPGLTQLVLNGRRPDEPGVPGEPSSKLLGMRAAAARSGGRVRRLDVVLDDQPPAAAEAEARELAPAVAQLPGLTSLALGVEMSADSSLSHLALSALAPAIATLGGLVRLDVSSGCMGPSGARVLAASVLPHLRLLRTLDLERNVLAAEGARELAAALPSLPELRTLNLEGNALVAAGAAALGAALPSLPELQTLNLADNALGAAGAAALVAGLAQAELLRDLDLSDNELGAAGVAALPRMSALRLLRLSDNALGADLAALVPALGAVLPRLPELRTLDLGGNGLEGEAYTYAIHLTPTKLAHPTPPIS